MKKYLALFAVLLLCFSGCEKQNESVYSFKVEKIDEYYDAVLNVTCGDFEKINFHYGDAVDVYINGEFFETIPYYDYFLGKTGSNQLVSFLATNTVCLASKSDGFALNNGIEIGDNVELKLNKDKSFLNQYNAYNISYSDNIEDYHDSISFINAREVSLGNMKHNILYRSASPFDNSRNRAPYVYKYVVDNDINTIVNLAQSREKLNEIADLNLTSIDLLNDIYYIGDSFSSDFDSSVFKEKFVTLLNELSKCEGPFLIHCLEGKDRTGFVCMLIEALCGATLEELEYDYMKTYENYYGVDTSDSRYQLLKDTYFIPLIETINMGEKVTDDIDTKRVASDFLLNIGLEKDVLDKLVDIFSE